MNEGDGLPPFRLPDGGERPRTFEYGGSAMTYSDGDQQSLYAWDRAFEYVVDQAGKPVVWPSKEFFKK